MSLFKWKVQTFLHWEMITKLQKYFNEILKSSPPEPLGQFYNINNHNFAQMYSLIWTGFSGERCGPWASCSISDKCVNKSTVLHMSQIANFRIWRIFLQQEALWPHHSPEKNFRAIHKLEQSYEYIASCLKNFITPPPLQQGCGP